MTACGMKKKRTAILARRARDRYSERSGMAGLSQNSVVAGCGVEKSSARPVHAKPLGC